MEPGIFSLVFGAVIALVMLPFRLGRMLMRWGQLHAQRRRYRAPQETNLRRASHPVGGLVVLLVAFSFYSARIEAARTALAPDSWLLMTLATVILTFGVASLVAGVPRSIGMVSDGTPYSTRAFFKLAGGAAAAVYLWRSVPLRAISETLPGLLAVGLLL